MIFAMRLSPLLFLSQMRVVAACAMMFPPSTMSCRTTSNVKNLCLGGSYSKDRGPSSISRFSFVEVFQQLLGQTARDDMFAVINRVLVKVCNTKHISVNTTAAMHGCANVFRNVLRRLNDIFSQTLSISTLKVARSCETRTTEPCQRTERLKMPDPSM